MLPTIFLLLCCSLPSSGQFYENSSQFKDLYGERQNLLLEDIYVHPFVAFQYNPDSLKLFRDEYLDMPVAQTSLIYGAPKDYIINLIFDPCRNYEPGCCYDRYGTPEYINRQNSSLQNIVMEDNQAQNLGESRVGDQLLIIDPICLALEEPLTVIDLCVGCFREEIDQQGLQSPLLYPLSECPPSTSFHCLDPTLYTGDKNLRQDFQELGVEITGKDGAFGTDYISDIVKGGKVDYKLLCRERYMDYPLQRIPESTWSSPIVSSIEIEESIYLKTYGGKWTDMAPEVERPLDWDPSTIPQCQPNIQKCKYWSNIDGFDPTKLSGYYLRIDNRTTSLNLTVEFSSGYVTAELDDGLRVLPEIQLLSGVEKSDRINFAISPGLNVININWCLNWNSADKKCDKTNNFFQYKFQVSKPFYTCRRVVLYRQDCIAKRVSKVQPYERPKCWDYNTSLVANNDCYWGNGTKRRYCITIAYTSTAYVTQCTGYNNAGAFTNDNHCGTFIEVHLPNITLGLLTGLYNKRQIEEVLIDMKLPPGLPSGYRTIPLPTQFNENPRLILCRGDYQIWWVLRTASEYVIEKRKTIYLTSPICDWDAANMRYKPYATIGRIDDYGGLPDTPAAMGSEEVPLESQIRAGNWWEEGYSTEEIADNKGFVFEGNDATLVPPLRL